MTAYEKPAELYDGLRLHQNENTGGCSPRVLEALARAAARRGRLLPAYAAATARVRRLSRRHRRPRRADQRPRRRHHGARGGVPAAASPAALVPEAIVPEPAFEIFRVDTEVVGGRVVPVMPKPDFQLRARRGACGHHARARASCS